VEGRERHNTGREEDTEQCILEKFISVGDGKEIDAHEQRIDRAVCGQGER